MTSKKYARERRARGTVQDVAPRVGVHPTTMNKRERGEVAITKQAEMMLLALPKLPRPVPAHTLGRKPGSLTKGKTLCEVFTNER